MKNNKTTAERFCHDILKLGIKHAKALIGIIMALGSEVEASSPTALSKSAFFQYHYSILNKVMGQFQEQLFEDNLSPPSTESPPNIQQQIQQMLMTYAPTQEVYKLISDFTTIRKPSSEKLEERTYVQVPNNKIAGNKSLDVGYYYSYVNLGLYDEAHPFAWCLPLSNCRLAIEDEKLAIAVGQLDELLEHADLPFKQAKEVVNIVDSGYAVPVYIAPLIAKHDNLTLIVRFRAGMKVYAPYEGPQKSSGRTKVYADSPYYLQTQRSRRCYNPHTKSYFDKAQTPIFDISPNEEDGFKTQTRRGRKLYIELYRWNDLLISGAKGHKMSDKPFDLIAVRCIDQQTGELIFKREMYLTIFGEKRKEHSLQDIYNDYRHRYDIEPHNRFSKQALLADKYQTPDVQHLDAWMWTVQLTWWLLYAASRDVGIYPNPWEVYLSEIKRAEQIQAPKSAAMTRKGAKILFSTFDLKPFEPQKSKNGIGRKKNYRPAKRPRAKPRRKNNTKEKMKLKTEQIE